MQFLSEDMQLNPKLSVDFVTYNLIIYLLKESTCGFIVFLVSIN